MENTDRQCLVVMFWLFSRILPKNCTSVGHGTPRTAVHIDGLGEDDANAGAQNARQRGRR